MKYKKILKTPLLVIMKNITKIYYKNRLNSDIKLSLKEINGNFIIFNEYNLLLNSGGCIFGTHSNTSNDFFTCYI